MTTIPSDILPHLWLLLIMPGYCVLAALIRRGSRP